MLEVIKATRLIVDELFSGILREDLFTNEFGETVESLSDNTVYSYCHWFGDSNGGFAGRGETEHNYEANNEFNFIEYSITEDLKIVEANSIPFYTGTLSEESLRVYNKMFTGLNVKYLPENAAELFNLSSETTNKPYYIVIGYYSSETCDRLIGRFCTLDEIEAQYQLEEDLVNEISDRGTSYWHQYHIQIYDAKTLEPIKHNIATKVVLTLE